MRIVFLIRSLDYGGAEVQLLNLARDLRDRGHSVLVSVLYAGRPLEPAFRDAGVTLVPLGKTGRWNVASRLVRLIALIRRDRTDVLHGYLTAANVLGGLARPFVPRTGLVWGYRSSNLQTRRYGRFVHTTTEIERRLSGLPDRIIGNSEAGRIHALALGFPAKTFQVVPNGIDTEQFHPDPESGRRQRERWGVAQDDTLVGIVARLDPMKDHPTLLRAVAEIAPSRPRLRLACIGNGRPAYANQLRRLADDLGIESRILWIPAGEDLPPIYNSLDLLCSASAWGEGFSNVIGEAMACGVPCVVTDVGDSARIVAETDSVVPPEDPQRLGEAILTSLLRKDVRGSPERRRRIVEEFGIEQLVGRTEAILRTVVEERRG